MHQEKATSTSIILRREAAAAPSGKATFRAHVLLLVVTALLFGTVTGMAVTWHIKPQYRVTIQKQRAVPVMLCPTPTTEATVVFIGSVPAGPPAEPPPAEPPPAESPPAQHRHSR